MLNESGPINYTIIETYNLSFICSVYIKEKLSMISPEKEENLASVPRLLVSVRICVYSLNMDCVFR